MKKLLFFLFLFATHLTAFAQYSRYIIRLKNKDENPFSITDPLKFLTQRSIDRRTRYGIQPDEADLPVTPAYIDSIRLSGEVIVLSVSKWLNQVCIRTTDAAALEKINTYTFVSGASPIAARAQTSHAVNKQLDASVNAPPPVTAKPLNPLDFYDYGVAYPQIHLHNAEFLHNQGFRGEGMQLAIMDAGFYHYKSLATFDSIRTNNQILGTWDFVDNQESVDEDYAHGMDCLSTIAANVPGSFVGTSPKSSFYLYRTEDVSAEYPVEEQNWVAAAEKADSLGADVFSVSLGYNLFDNSVFNYTYSDMDGNTSIIAKGADIAAKKGILLVVAAGNNGNNSWKYITTPADADSVLTVGAVNAARQVAAFSSFGPSADGQIKPDVAAIGQNVVIADQNTGNPTYGSGTSYACPIMAGIVTCLWQAFPEVSSMGIIDAVRKSSDKAEAPDDRTGYGVPDAKKAFVLLVKKLYTQQISMEDTCKVKLSFAMKTSGNADIVVERKLPAELNYKPLTTLNAAGNFAAHNFIYTDDLSTTAPGIIKYRVKMIMGADTSFYLDSANVNYSKPCGLVSVTEKIIINPNPAHDQLNIQITRNRPVQVVATLYSISGQKIYSVGQSVNGTQQIVIPTKQLSNGIYLVTVFINGKKELVKTVIRN